MTLTAPPQASSKPIALELEGRADIGGKTIIRPADPADDRMQAFLYRHLVPAQQLLACVQKSRWRMPDVEIMGRDPVQIPAGGSVQIRLKIPPRPFLREIDLELYDPPAGITLQDVTVVREGLVCVLKADKDAFEKSVSDNLIIQAFREYVPKQQAGKTAPKKQRDSMGLIPAIPIRIVCDPQTEKENENPDGESAEQGDKQI